MIERDKWRLVIGIEDVFLNKRSSVLLDAKALVNEVLLGHELRRIWKLAEGLI